MEDIKKISVRFDFPEDDHRRLKAAAALSGRTIPEQAIYAIQQWLAMATAEPLV
jgi:hypothetical protein